MAFAGLGAFFTLGVKGLGGVFSIFRKTSSRVGDFVMAEPTEQQKTLARLLQKDPKEDSYYEAFGRFIATYSNAEISIHSLTRFFSGTDDAKARILVGGMRLGDVTERLRGLLAINDARKGGLLALSYDEGRTEIIEECLSQMAVITDKRHKLIHRHLSYDEQGFSLTDIPTVKKIQNFEINLITLADLMAMRSDCLVIAVTLRDFERQLGTAPYWNDQNPRPPWRYTPPKPPPKPEAQIREDRKATKRQYRASVVKSRKAEK